MAFQTGTAADLVELFSALQNFASTNGWVVDRDAATRQPALHRNNVYVQFRFDGSGALGGVRNIGMWQSLGFNVLNNHGDHIDDSGNGAAPSAAPTDLQLGASRAIEGVNEGPFPSYYFFTGTSTPSYLHAVIEIETGVYRHFGFGELDKVGGWTGGEYAYGHAKQIAGPLNLQDTAMLDGLHNVPGSTKAATMRLESLPGQPVASKWAQVWGSITGAPNDRGGTVKEYVQGGFRAGPYARAFGFVPPSSTSDGGYPMYSIGLFHRRSLNGNVRFLGTQADVRGINIRNLEPAFEFRISNERWISFPVVEKDTASGFQGIAYRVRE